MKTNLEKASSLWIGLFILVMSVIYVFVTIGQTDWVIWISIVWGVFLSILLFIESGIIVYFQKKDYKKLTMGDGIVFLTLIIATGILMNTIFLINVVSDIIPSYILNFT